MKKLAYSFCRAVRSSLLIELVLGKAIRLGIERSHREPEFSLTFFVDNETKDWRKTGVFGLDVVQRNESECRIFH